MHKETFFFILIKFSIQRGTLNFSHHSDQKLIKLLLLSFNRRITILFLFMKNKCQCIHLKVCLYATCSRKSINIQNLSAIIKGKGFLCQILFNFFFKHVIIVLLPIPFTHNLEKLKIPMTICL